MFFTHICFISDFNFLKGHIANISEKICHGQSNGCWHRRDGAFIVVNVDKIASISRSIHHDGSFFVRIGTSFIRSCKLNSAGIPRWNRK